jgi:hypothetical protein
MGLLNRFGTRRFAALTAAILIALSIAAVMVVVASGEEDPSEAGMDVKVEPTTNTPSAASPPPGQPGAIDEVPDGPLTSTTAPAPSGVDDPDRPVSSDDSPPSPRPRPSPPDDGIDSFEECAAAGYPIAESYPEQCFTPDGRSFTRVIP